MKGAHSTGTDAGFRHSRIPSPRPCSFWCEGRAKAKRRRSFAGGHAERWRGEDRHRGVQVDHMTLSIDGKVFKEFSFAEPFGVRAVCPKTRRQYAQVFSRATSGVAKVFLSEVPQSARPEVDWQRHRIDRSMRHYDTVMAWVGLFLFNHGLATFAGRHVNQALLFPMEEVFEDFVVDAFQRYQRDYRVRTQGPQESFTKIGNQQAFHMKPDIALIRAGEVHFILDAKWKKGADNSGNDPKHGVTQNDIYQLYAYGRKFGCATVALVYPQTQKFRAPLRYEFNDSVDGQPLTLLCLPFNVEQPAYSVREILVQLTSQ